MLRSAEVQECVSSGGQKDPLGIWGISGSIRGSRLLDAGRACRLQNGFPPFFLAGDTFVAANAALLNPELLHSSNPR